VFYYSRGVVKSVGSKGYFRSISRRLEHTVRTGDLRIDKFIKFADEITHPFSLQDIRNVRNNKEEASKMELWCKELEKDGYPSRPFSGKHLDKNGVPFFYYLGQRIEGEPPKRYTLTTDSTQNFWKQLEGRQQYHLDRAERNGQKVITDGFDVSISIPVFCSSAYMSFLFSRSS
jgi:hypothetical protein